jgi:RecJ-like exonuclease
VGSCAPPPGGCAPLPALPGPPPRPALLPRTHTAACPRPRADQPVTLSTGPSAPLTHWAQTVLTLPEPVTLLAPGAEAAAGQKAAHEIRGRISMSRGSKHRLLDMVLEYSAACTDGSRVEQVTMYSMEVVGSA